MSKWPKDNQQALIAFYGKPGPQVENQLVPVVPPFRMTYEGKPIKSIRFHKLAAPALLAALNEIWEHYGKDQNKIDELGISIFSGAYNPRYIRGSTTKWSNHAYGAAIDLNAEENGFGTGKGNIPLPVIAAFKRQGARWGGDYKGRTDPMHLEFCDAGEGGVQTAAPAGVASPTPPTLTLRKGSKGQFVEALQSLLNKKGANLRVDGDYGNDTANAVRIYQTHNGLIADGVAGPQVMNSLRG